MSEAIDQLLTCKVSWLAESPEYGDIAISSRIRLARNIIGFPFPIAAAEEQLTAVRQGVLNVVKESGCLGHEALIFILNELDEVERGILLERRLISPDALARSRDSAVVVGLEEGAALMVNEEDHLRLQVLRPGFQLQAAWQEIDALDNCLGRHLDFAYDHELGFLTSCPTNVGTGMRASVMLHLPALVLAGEITPAIQGINKLGLTVRGGSGEGTDNSGNLFQVSNQSTLGESETAIITRLENVIARLIEHEKDARRRLMEQDQYRVLDQVGRAYGRLRHAYILTTQDALNSLSWMRFGVNLGMFSTVDIHTINELLLLINPAHLTRFSGKPHLEAQERDIFRANLVRERLRRLSNREN